MGDLPQGSDSSSNPGFEPTAEEKAAFEADAQVVADYADLAAANLNAEGARITGEIADAVASGASPEEIDSLREQGARHGSRLLYALLAIIIGLIVAYILFYDSGIDTLAGTGDGSVSTEAENIAPPEPAATPAEVLPPEVFAATCADCGEVVQVPLELNEDAKYQFAYESGGSRLAIFTVVDGSEYDGLAESIESAYEAAVADGENPDPPKELDDVGEGAIVYRQNAIFRNADECGVLIGNTLQDGSGEQFDTLSTEELERLARIAAPRM